MSPGSTLTAATSPELTPTTPLSRTPEKNTRNRARSAARTIERNTLRSRAAGAPKSGAGAFASVRGGRNGEIDLALAGGGAARLEYAVTLPRCS